MKYSLVILFLFNGFVVSGQEWRLWNQPWGVVFADDANVRAKPSLSSEIINVLDENSNTEYVDAELGVTLIDTIGGRPGRWRSIATNAGRGYIWDGVFAKSVFVSTLDKENQFLVQFSSNNELKIKVLNQSKKTQVFVFPRQEEAKLFGMKSLGKIIGSKNNEVLVAVFQDENEVKNTLELFEWNGTTIVPSNLTLRDSSIIFSKHMTFSKGIIEGDRVNFRKEPQIDSEIITSLEKNTFVTVEEKIAKKDTLNGEVGYWSKISVDENTGYIWASFLGVSISYVKSNTKEGESYFYTPRMLYVLKDGEVVSQTKSGYYSNDVGLYDIGNLGMDENFTFLTMYYHGYSCGVPQGRRVFLWDGKTVKKFVHDEGVVDGGLASGNNFIFPLEPGGIPGKIVNYIYDGESISYPGKNSSYRFIDYYAKTRILAYNGDTLVEMPSKDYFVAERIKKEFPKHQLQHCHFTDINQDGIEDALAFIIAFRDENVDFENRSFNPCVTILYGEEDGGFVLKTKNENIVSNKYTGVVFEKSNEGITVSVIYNVGYYPKGEYGPAFEKFEFKYDKAADELYWYSKTESGDIGNNNNDWDVKWDLKTNYFKSKKIAFTDVWRNTDLVE